MKNIFRVEKLLHIMLISCQNLFEPENVEVGSLLRIPIESALVAHITELIIINTAADIYKYSIQREPQKANKQKAFAT